MCTDFEINCYKIDEFRKHRMFYLTSRDAQTVRRTSWGLGYLYFDQEHFEINQKSQVMVQTVGFMVLVTLTLTFDLCYIFVTRNCLA